MNDIIEQMWQQIFKVGYVRLNDEQDIKKILNDAISRYCSNCSLQQSVNEALNSGDGTYHP